jgi:hypothetical protein
MSELLKETKHTIKLGDKEYEIPELSWNDLCAIEDELGCSIAGLQDKFAEKQISTMRSLVYALLKGKYPEITKEIIGQQGKLRDMKTVAETIFEVINKSMGE